MNDIVDRSRYMKKKNMHAVIVLVVSNVKSQTKLFFLMYFIFINCNLKTFRYALKKKRTVRQLEFLLTDNQASNVKNQIIDVLNSMKNQIIDNINLAKIKFWKNQIELRKIFDMI